jgi:hypothetical protein
VFSARMRGANALRDHIRQSEIEQRQEVQDLA